MEGIEAREVVEGQIVVTTPDGRSHQVLLPAGVGVPGADDEHVAAALVLELLTRGEPLPQVLDASQLLARHPGLLLAVSERLDRS
jgi:hypothetical protein